MKATNFTAAALKFLGFVVKSERKRKTPDPKTWTDNLVGKPYPDLDRLKKKIEKVQAEIRKIETFSKPTARAAQIHYINSVIMGIAQYLQPSICSRTFEIIDRRVNNTALAVWKNMFPNEYNNMQVPLNCLCNLPHRHENYQSTTFAIQVEGDWFGLTYAFITHSRHESKPFDQKITPYTADGRKRYLQRCSKNKRLPCDRPSINSPEDIAFSIYRKGKDWKMNFEYFMNRETKGNVNAAVKY